MDALTITTMSIITEKKDRTLKKVAKTVLREYDRLREKGVIKTEAAYRAAKKYGICQRTVYNYLKLRDQS